MRLFKCSQLEKAFSLAFGVAQSLHKKSKDRTLGQARLLKKQAATPLHNAQSCQPVCWAIYTFLHGTDGDYDKDCELTTTGAKQTRWKYNWEVICLTPKLFSLRC